MFESTIRDIKYNIKGYIMGNNTLNIVILPQTRQLMLTYCIMYLFDKYKIVTMEALSYLYQDHCLGAQPSISIAKEVEMA